MKIGIAGAAGKMGQALIRAVKEHPELTLGAAWERPDHPSLGQDAGLLAGQDRTDIILSDDMSYWHDRAFSPSALRPPGGCWKNQCGLCH
jgi:dihydrodipicolinate reductase